MMILNLMVLFSISLPLSTKSQKFKNDRYFILPSSHHNLSLDYLISQSHHFSLTINSFKFSDKSSFETIHTNPK